MKKRGKNLKYTNDFQPKVAVIILNYCNYQDTLSCIKSLLKIDYSNYKVFVVDNNSPNESLKYLNTIIENNVEIIESGMNGGFAYGNNIGIKMALEDNSDYVLLLNNDTLVDKNFLEPLLCAAEKEKNVGIVSPRIMFYPDADKIWYAGGKVDWNNLRAIHYGLKEKLSDGYLKEAMVNFASGCCMLIPREVIDTVGFLPEEYFMYYEDMDYCVKVMDKGYKIKYVPESVIYHRVSSSSGGEESAFCIEWQNRARRTFMKKYGNDIFNPFTYVLVSIKCEMRSLVKIVLSTNKKNKLQAYIASFRNTLRMDQ